MATEFGAVPRWEPRAFQASRVEGERNLPENPISSANARNESPAEAADVHSQLCTLHWWPLGTAGAGAGRGVK
jgi:hypothetical protein